jgi:hypothetical protein
MAACCTTRRRHRLHCSAPRINRALPSLRRCRKSCTVSISKSLPCLLPIGMRASDERRGDSLASLQRRSKLCRARQPGRCHVAEPIRLTSLARRLCALSPFAVAGSAQPCPVSSDPATGGLGASALYQAPALEHRLAVGGRRCAAWLCSLPLGAARHGRGGGGEAGSARHVAGQNNGCGRAPERQPGTAASGCGAPALGQSGRKPSEHAAFIDARGLADGDGDVQAGQHQP